MTRQGQKLLRPVVTPIRYATRLNADAFPKETSKEFNLTKRDQALSLGIGIHSVNHVKQNMRLANRINCLNEENMAFKRSILNKTNGVNLKLMKMNNLHRHEKKREVKISNNQKWDNFRLEREETVKIYLKAKRK